MLAIGIRYLCGWAMATHPADRRRPEWPPHPDRVFQALAAAHFETDGGPDEHEALRRLSELPGPAISASPHHERTAVTTFVPVNDEANPFDKKGRLHTPVGSLPIGRQREARAFPVAVPERDVVYLIWPDAEWEPGLRRALDGLCRKVAAVGHSASLVQVWAEAHPPDPDHVPTDRPGARLRLQVPHPGRLVDLSTSFEAELRPTPAGWHGYGPPRLTEDRPESRRSVFSPDLIVLRRVQGRSLGLESTLLLTETLRRAIIKHCPEPVPEWVSGHDGADGPPSRRPHLAFFPLPDVGHPHAEGRLLGLALAIPDQGISPEEQRRALGPSLFDELGRSITVQLRKGDLVAWDLALDDREDRPAALRPEVWTTDGVGRPAACWATVTPIVLDRYPKAPGDAEATIRRACLNVGLPDPEEVVTTPAPPFLGVPHARRFPPPAFGPGGGTRFHTHAVLRFPQAVRGPVLLGAGRYRGYGLCRPRPGGRR